VLREQSRSKAPIVAQAEIYRSPLRPLLDVAL